MDRLTVRKADRASAGSCNFCSGTSTYRKVYAVTSPLPGGISVRLCRKCYCEMVKQVRVSG